MKFAPACSFSAVVACLLAHGHSAYGSSSLRPKIEKEDRKLNGYGYQDPYYHQPYPQNVYYDPYGYSHKQPDPPTELPTPRPTPLPTERPTPEPTPRPSARPSPRPSPNPTPMPTTRPTPNPTTRPPTEQPTPRPTTAAPTPHPTRHPTREPSSSPSPAPTGEPSAPPSPEPSPEPSPAPSISQNPTLSHPSSSPSENPTQSAEPSENPTQSAEPSENPTQSEEPSENPTQSAEPSEVPTVSEEPTNQARTIAQIICAEENTLIFGDFCLVLRITGLDFFLNDFEPLLFGRRELQGGVPIVPNIQIPNIPNNVVTTIDDLDFVAFNNLFENFFEDNFANNPFANFVDGRGFQQFVAEFLNDYDVQELWTVFAPNNAAIRSLLRDLDWDVLNLSRQQRLQLTNIALYHIIAGEPITFGNLRCGRRYRMSNNGRTRTECQESRGITQKFQVGTGNTDLPLITRPRNVLAINGLVHSVDEVILPFTVPNRPTEPPTGFGTNDCEGVNGIFNAPGN